MKQSDKISRRHFLNRTFSSISKLSILYSGMFSTKTLFASSLSKIPSLENKHKDLSILNDRPINIETPAWLLDEKVTSEKYLFVRNNGIPPIVDRQQKIILRIEGESVQTPVSFSLDDLKEKFKHYSYQLVLECGGNGRAEFNPAARGNQWTTGGVGCPMWTGVRLKDVLNSVGLKEDAVYVGYYGQDKHLTGVPGKVPISRGVPIDKAMQDESLIVWGMNNQDLPDLHGYPLRLMFGGWPASASGKWLDKIVVRNRIHDGPKMGGYSYRVPCDPVAPGSDVAAEDMCVIESMPVKSIITAPKSGSVYGQNESVRLRGHAWAGDNEVLSMALSHDFGQSWEKIKLDKPVNRHAWQHWEAQFKFDTPGYYEIWARATDEDGLQQPMIIPGWNPRGYLNNACHRIAIRVT